MTAGGVNVPSAQTVTMTVIFSFHLAAGTGDWPFSHPLCAPSDPLLGWYQSHPSHMCIPPPHYNLTLSVLTAKTRLLQNADLLHSLIWIQEGWTMTSLLHLSTSQ